jgi:hypothetical protein
MTALSDLGAVKEVIVERLQLYISLHILFVGTEKSVAVIYSEVC